jgi:DNA-binding NtrC family response regulator
MHLERRREELRPVPRHSRVALHGRDASEFRSRAYRAALDQLRRYARDSHVTILLEGEAGTGKTQHAAYAHHVSPRASRPFQVGLLAAVHDTFGESELFGHVAGAFTDARQARTGLFASASGGTVFLDEIGKASRRVQQLLLHVVEYGEVKPLGSDRVIRIDARLVAATNVSLESLVETNSFLPDLRARLCMFRVVLPPLRDRRSDIPLLVDDCVRRRADACGYATAPSIHPELMAALKGAPWPDNLRQLDATVYRLMIEAEGAPELTPDLCTGDLSYLRLRRKRKPGALGRGEVEAAIALTGGDKSKAARILHVDRTTVHRILQRSESS